MNTTLVIMAAGIGMRFGNRIKQLTPVGPNGELIIDYSIHDAILAGFNKIIFIIRKDIEQEFKAAIGDRIKSACEKLNVQVEYTFQCLDDLPVKVEVPCDRKKPWGTGQALWTCRNIVKEPFVVISADDYYGRSIFFQLHEYITNNRCPRQACMAGYVLKNTLSESGAVTRGICEMDGNYNLTKITETYHVIKRNNEVFSDNGKLDMNSCASMSMWGFQPEFLECLEDGFVDFFEHITDWERDEYLLPKFIGILLDEKKIAVKVLPTPDKWVGVTYQEDVQLAQDSIAEFIKDGVYPHSLY